MKGWTCGIVNQHSHVNWSKASSFFLKKINEKEISMCSIWKTQG